MPSPDLDSTLNDLQLLAAAESRGRLGAAAAGHVRQWLTQSEYAAFRPALKAHLRDGEWDILQDVFWRWLPFEASDRRGRVYPLGCNAINVRTVGETVEALANYAREVYEGPPPLSCAVAFDARPESASFAQLAAEIMACHGFQVLFFEWFRSASELAMTVRYKQCACGVMITGSHLPPGENGIKIVWSHGGPLPFPHAQVLKQRITAVGVIHSTSFPAAVNSAQIQFAAEEMDSVYRDRVVAEGFGMARGKRHLRIVYRPLHGAAHCSVPRVLQADGFDATCVLSHDPTIENAGSQPKPIFAGTSAEPLVREPPVDPLFSSALDHQADLILATSGTDADRIECAAPLRLGENSWRFLDSQQIAVLLADYVLRQRQASGTLSAQHYLLKTRLTTEMLSRVAASYQVRCESDCPAGFRCMGQRIDPLGADRLVLAADEAHGYLVGTHLRDRDGAVTALLLAEAAADAKREGRSLHEELDRLYRQHGLFVDLQTALALPGEAGHRRMLTRMHRLRREPPREIGGIAVTDVRDFGVIPTAAARPQANTQPQEPENLLFFQLQLEGHALAIRFSDGDSVLLAYGFGYLPREQLEDVTTQRQSLKEWLAARISELLEN